MTEASGENYERGGKPYFRPYGWKRYAIKVKGKYEDDAWLGTVRSDQYRTNSDNGKVKISNFKCYLLISSTLSKVSGGLDTMAQRIHKIFTELRKKD